MSADKELIERLRSLSGLEPGWYANVGARTGEACCQAMREAAARLEALQRSRGAPGREGEPVAWLVKDFADGRFATAEKISADLYAQRGHHVQPLYASPTVEGGEEEGGSSQSQPCADGTLPVLTETQQANLAGFAAQVLEALWENYDLDGGDIEGLGQRFGLIRQVQFDPERHTDVHGVGAEAGDDWFVQEPWLTRWSKAAREGTRVAAGQLRDEQNPLPAPTTEGK